MNLKRSTVKGLRDFVVVAAGILLLALVERAADFGVPDEAIPLVSAAALLAYRVLRGAAGKDPATTGEAP